MVVGVEVPELSAEAAAEREGPAGLEVEMIPMREVWMSEGACFSTLTSPDSSLFTWMLAADLLKTWSHQAKSHLSNFPPSYCFIKIKVQPISFSVHGLGAVEDKEGGAWAYRESTYTLGVVLLGDGDTLLDTVLVLSETIAALPSKLGKLLLCERHGAIPTVVG